MKTIGNSLWLILAGVWLAIGAFKLSVLALWPFGQAVVSNDQDPNVFA